MSLPVDQARLVAANEFRMRIRAGRWRWLLVAWFAVLLAFQSLLALGMRHSYDERPIGPVLFGGLMLFVLSGAMLVVPALSATSINGDRERGTLAPLQVSLLSPAEITLGKLVAAWGTSLVFLALTLPLVGWAWLAGGLPLVNIVAVLLVMSLLLGVVAAVSQCLSSLLARTTTSAVLSYLLVFGLGIGTVVLFMLVTSVVDNGDNAPTTTTWPLLAPNPIAILADSAPTLPRHRDENGELVSDSLDPLGALGQQVRDLRNPQVYAFDVVAPTEPQRDKPVWPWGLGFDVLLAAGAVAVTTRRLRTPATRLPSGARVA